MSYLWAPESLIHADRDPIRDGLNAYGLGSDSGAYQLLIRFGPGRELRVGALGIIAFPPGFYVYTGRASRGLLARLKRHLRREKTLRWHVDYLLAEAEVSLVRLFPGGAERECDINADTAGADGYPFPIRGFGSSDCSCPSHLVWLGNPDQYEV